MRRIEVTIEIHGAGAERMRRKERKEKGKKIVGLSTWQAWVRIPDSTASLETVPSKPRSPIT